MMNYSHLTGTNSVQFLQISNLGPSIKKSLNLLASICLNRKRKEKEEKVSLSRLTPGGNQLRCIQKRATTCRWVSVSWDRTTLALPVALCLHLTTQSTVLYLFLRLLLLAGCWWLLGHTQLGGHGGRVLAADRAAG